MRNGGRECGHERSRTMRRPATRNRFPFIASLSFLMHSAMDVPCSRPFLARPTAAFVHKIKLSPRSKGLLRAAGCRARLAVTVSATMVRR